MVRGRGFSSRGGYRGGRGSWGGGYSDRYGSDPRDRYDPRTKYAAESFSSRSYGDDYKSYRMESYMGRDRRSPERKRMRMEGPSSRHDSSYNSSYGSSRHEPPSSYSERRGYSGERHSSSAPYRKEDYRSSGPSPRGSYRGRLSSRGSRGLRARDRPVRRRLIESSYTIRRRTFPRSDFSRRLRLAKLRRVTKKKELDGEEEEDDDEKKLKDEQVENEEDTAAEGEEDKKSSPEKKKPVRESLEETISKRGFIKLQCPHCNVKCLTFRKYEFHLSSRLHLSTMRRLAIKHKSILIQMRRAQRKSQNELEKDTVDDLDEAATNFCPICRLNYKQKKSVHQLSESHKNMKKFLSPVCKVCEIAFRSPIAYEGHVCSISHMKRKHLVESGSDAEIEDNDLENFTTIDSVGDGTEPTEGASTSEEKPEKKEVSIGVEMVRKIEAHYCDLCKMYLTRGDEDEMPKIIARHCKQPVHMRKYVRMKEHELKVKRAAAKKAKTEKKEGDNNPDQNGDVSMKEENKDGEEGADDKLWADVDKDLGDILAEAESGNKSSDEDEDSHVNGERYDRFKLSEKTDEDKIMDTEESDKTKEKEATTEA